MSLALKPGNFGGLKFFSDVLKLMRPALGRFHLSIVSPFCLT